MGTWETETTKASYDAQSAINTTVSNREAGRAGATGSMDSSGGNFFGFGAYSVVGMQVSAVDGMRQAIRDYVSNIQTHLDGIHESAETKGAFLSNDGEVEKAVQEFITNVETYCKNLVSDLNAFNDKIGDVKNAWIATTGNLAGTITEDVAASDTGTTYQETIK